ncbi:sensor histidine kinase [Bradyrhizobium sp. McL0616]|uniref:sensor histidine kinase n=1 Tax=Bradyrhizobium sp. McL0616 TaxID=3415674 RepID=UPI003CF78192
MSIAPDVQLRQRLAELARSHRYSVARELAATIAHEINQPLGAILANAETLEALLQSPKPDLSELGAIAADIRLDSHRAADVIRNLKNLLKRSNPEFKEVNLNEPVQDAIRFFTALTVAQDTPVRSSIAPMPLPVKGNALQLHQVILNLLVNAVDAMSGLHADQRRLEIATVRAENSADVFISDTGPGISPDMLKEIFAPFFSTKEQGMGLGLSIARTLVEAHDGQIWAENRPSGGAVFCVRLPLLRA